MNKLLIKTIHNEAKIPFYAKEGDAGLDLFTVEDTLIPSCEARAIKTGLTIALPQGTEGQIRPRSGNSLNGVPCYVGEELKKVYVQVAIGTVDFGYRGEIGIITYNPTGNDVIVPAGTKLAQMVINKIERPVIEIVEELTETDRGSNGFGSTGV